MNNRILSLLSVLVLGGVAAVVIFPIPPARAAERLVPGDYGTIQSAIEAAADGDVIIIQPGIYRENIDFCGKGIIIRSGDPNDPDIVASTIIDGGNSGSVVTCAHGEGTSSVLSGVTVRNGQAKAPFTKGGGIFCQSSSPLIKKCTIVGNSAPFGGGIYCLEASPEITNCIIMENLAFEKGGGIYCDWYSSPDITSCVVSRNSASSGGGISVSHCSSPFILNSIFWDNGSEITADSEAGPKVSYCDIQHGCPGPGNIDADPLFIDPEAGNYHLQTASPCRDAGHPRLLDADGSRSDIGACGGEGSNGPELTRIAVAADGSCDFTTIQQAIDSAFPGDTIVVYPGRYRENILLSGKDIAIISQSGPNSTIIDGSQTGSALTLINIGSNGLLDGFTIQNGSAQRYGGGIHCLNSSLTISNCQVVQNLAVESGGGIFCNHNSSPSIVKCMISGNSAASGGGISCERSWPALTDCQITGNSATGNLASEDEDFNGGGGIFCCNSAPVITNCIITDNSAPCGGGISCFGSMCYQPKVVNCTISLNQASHRGGGIYCQCDALDISNSTITGNSADYGGGIYCTWPITGFATRWTIANCVLALNSARLGAGINCSGYTLSSSPEYNFPSPKIINCTIIGNSASLSGGGILSDQSSPVVTNCILWGNAPNEVGDKISRITRSGILRGYRDVKVVNQLSASSLKISYSNIQGGYQGSGNISLPPLFADLINGDYHLQYGSPCIDAGNDPAIPGAENDRDGEVRPWDGDSDGVARYDMGAYEYRGFVPPIIWISLGLYPGESPDFLRGRKIQLVVLGREGLDVTAIDPETILLGRKGIGENIAPARWSYADIPVRSTPSINVQDLSGDGYNDLILTFNNQQVMRSLALREVQEGMICLTLSGLLKDGSLIKGQVDVALSAMRPPRAFKFSDQ